MNERLQAIIVLLETRDEGLPEPAVPRTHAASGFAHDVTVVLDCPDCLTNGRRMFGCETCGGSGHVSEHRDQDPYAVNTVQPFGLSPDRHEATRRRDSEIARLTEQTKPPYESPADELADANKHPYPWEVERRKRYRTFDYAALDRALDALRLADEAAYHLLHTVYVYGFVELSVTLEAVVARGLVFLSSRLPDPIRAPGFETGAARRKVLQRANKT